MDTENTNKRVRLNRARRWVFTWNNYPETGLDQIRIYLESRNMKYVIGKEVGEQGTPHLQGYLEAKHSVDFDTFKKHFPMVHWEKAKGSKQNNIVYCTKEEDYISSGNDMNRPVCLKAYPFYDLSIDFL